MEQYGAVHVLVDFVNFSKFLFETGVLDSSQVASFLTGTTLIPSSSIGTFQSSTLRQILMTLRDASNFLKSDYFVPREGYQRRVLGYLLERLNSHLILTRIQSGLSESNFGYHTILSRGPSIKVTVGPISEEDSRLKQFLETHLPIEARRFLETHLPEGARQFLKAYLAGSN